MFGITSNIVIVAYVVVVAPMFGVVCNNITVFGVARVAFNIEYTLDGVMDDSESIAQGNIQTYVISFSHTFPFL